MVEKVCEPLRTSPRADRSQKPATLGSNQCVEIRGVGYSPWKQKKDSWVYCSQEALPCEPCLTAKSPQKTSELSTYMKLERVTVTLKALVSMSTVRQIIYKWRKFSTVAAAPRLGRPVKTAARAPGRESAEDSQNSLAHAHTWVSNGCLTALLPSLMEPWGERIPADLLRKLLNRNSFVKSPKFLLTVKQIWSGQDQCCQSKVNRLMKSKASKYFPPCTWNIYMLCSTKTWNQIIVWCVISLSKLCLFKVS